MTGGECATRVLYHRRPLEQSDARLSTPVDPPMLHEAIIALPTIPTIQDVTSSTSSLLAHSSCQSRGEGVDCPRERASCSGHQFSSAAVDERSRMAYSSQAQRSSHWSQGRCRNATPAFPPRRHAPLVVVRGVCVWCAEVGFDPAPFSSSIASRGCRQAIWGSPTSGLSTVCIETSRQYVLHASLCTGHEQAIKYATYMLYTAFLRGSSKPQARSCFDVSTSRVSYAVIMLNVVVPGYLPFRQSKRAPPCVSTNHATHELLVPERRPIFCNFLQRAE